MRRPYLRSLRKERGRRRCEHTTKVCAPPPVKYEAAPTPNKDQVVRNKLCHPEAGALCPTKDLGEPRHVARSLRHNNRAFGSRPYCVTAGDPQEMTMKFNKLTPNLVVRDVAPPA
jgi:hypothetical protein